MAKPKTAKAPKVQNTLASKANTKKRVSKITGGITKPDTDYNVKAEIAGEIYTGKSKDLQEAILQIQPLVFKGKTIMTVTIGKKKVEYVMFVPQARLVFRNKLAAEILAKRLMLQLK